MEMEEEPFEVSLRFAPEAATYAAERRWSRDQRCEMHDDGSVRLPIRAHNEAECLSWVLGFADRAQALAPDWLRREVKKTVYAMARLCHTPRKPADTAESGGLACRGLLPAAAGVTHDAGPVCILTGCSSIRYFVLAHPVRIHAGSSQSVLYLCPSA